MYRPPDAAMPVLRAWEIPLAAHRHSAPPVVRASECCHDMLGRAFRIVVDYDNLDGNRQTPLRQRTLSTAACTS